MVDYRRTAERRTIKSRNRSGALAAAAAVSSIATAIMAAPAIAAPAPTRTVDSGQRINADGSVDVTGTYTCSGGQTDILVDARRAESYGCIP
ncbi:hypothetical protein DFR70_11587 [Nocardia tenerifensis]|uniref:Secreted protein n=1 Tax=Nocardia tenerifensis TaxID=228006 RepID=A0A318JQZ8_9NOCA|nr:hypothetical protein [Nocardia tenerifensis]PXX58114.1 hypothetical protein DFR70_11587 [Nocardia tenerifensis]